MSILKDKMAVKCRTSEEIAAFVEIANAEGHYYANCGNINPSKKTKQLYVVGYDKHHRFPNDVTSTGKLDILDKYPGEIETVVEGADLFRDYISAKRQQTPKKQHFFEAKTSEVIAALQELPADMTVCFCGTSEGYLHVDTKENICSFDYSDLSEEYEEEE